MKHTNSSIKTWRQCRRLYYYKYVEMVRMARQGKALGFGTLAHQCVDIFFTGGLVSIAIGAIDVTEGGIWDDQEVGPIEKARLRAMMRAYWVKWAHTRKDWHKVETEKVFNVTICGVDVMGKTDGLMHHRKTADLWIQETKTTSDDIATSGDDFWLRMPIDSQVVLYRQAMAVERGEVPRVLYDVMRKPLGKPKMKKAVSRRKTETADEHAARKAEQKETIDEFEDRLFSAIMADPDKYLVRREIVQNFAVASEQIAGFLETALEIEKYKGLYPCSDGACKAWSLCPYIGCCTGTETLQDPKFVKLTTPHPELPEDGQGDYSVEDDGCPI